MKWLRTARVVLIGVIATGVASVSVTLLALRNPTTPRIDKVARSWSRTMLRAAGVDLTVEGTEHIDPTQSYVIVSNHQSAFDIPAHFLALPVPVRFLAKTELFRIPIFGTALRAIGIIEVDRAAGAKGHDPINQAAIESTRRGRSVLVYAEGTRTRSGQLLPFKRGAFQIAAGTSLPILPVTVSGSFDSWPPGSLIAGGAITVVVSPPIETAGLDRAQVMALRDETKNIIANRLAELNRRESDR